jgi:hypothetical protein
MHLFCEVKRPVPVRLWEAVVLGKNNGDQSNEKQYHGRGRDRVGASTMIGVTIMEEVQGKVEANRSLQGKGDTS